MKKARSGSWKTAAMTTVCVVLSLVLLVMLAATVYVEIVFGKIDRMNLNQSVLSQEEFDALNSEANGTSPSMNEEDVIFGGDPQQIIGGDGIVNIMLVGQDRRAGEGRQRSDAMILCTVNRNARTLTLTSFMRDVYVEIPGYRSNKLNSCYQIGGSELLDACLEKNFGIRVDANIEVDFDGFMELIDTVDGVEIELTEKEANYLNRRGNWDVETNQNWQLRPGINLLNGSQALAYSRIRDIGMDFERTERQRKVLMALLEKAKTQDILQINALVMDAAELVTTDMTDQEIFSYVRLLFPMLSDMQITTQRIPVDGTYRFADLPGAGDAIVIDFEANRKILAESLGGETLGE